MKFCNHCKGPCTNTPTMGPQSREYLGTSLDEICPYKENWAVGFGRPISNFIFHMHDGEYYGVFNHYWTKEQGWPHREPILICSYCEIQIPPEIEKHLSAFREFMRPKSEKI